MIPRTITNNGRTYYYHTSCKRLSTVRKLKKKYPKSRYYYLTTQRKHKTPVYHAYLDKKTR